MSLQRVRIPYNELLTAIVAQVATDAPTLKLVAFPDQNTARPYCEIVGFASSEDVSTKDSSLMWVQVDFQVYGVHQTAKDANDLAETLLGILTSRHMTLADDWSVEDVRYLGPPRAQKTVDQIEGTQFWALGFSVRWLVSDGLV